MSNPIIDEFLAIVDAAIDAGEIRLLFWVCPVDHDKQNVTWAKNVPRCEICEANNL